MSFLIYLGLLSFTILDYGYLVQATPVQVFDQNMDSRLSFIRDRESLPDYQPLCQTTRHRVDLNEQDFEFRPPFYYITSCTRYNKHHPQSINNYNKTSSAIIEGSEVCLQTKMACVQRFRTIQIAKRKIGTSCWSLTHRDIHSGCDCMWPVQSLGDSSHHF